MITLLYFLIPYLKLGNEISEEKCEEKKGSVTWFGVPTS